MLTPIEKEIKIYKKKRKEAPTGNSPMGATPHKAVTSRFPQAGGNRTSEAPGVILDPTLGDEGVETLPPQ